MKKKSVLIITILLIMTAAAGLRQPLQARAASAALGFLLQTPEVTVGDVVSVYLTIESDGNIGDFEGYISYDSDYLEFRTGTSGIAGGDGVLKVSDIYTAASDTSRKYLLKFTALKPGSCEISMMNQPKVYEYETALPMSTSMTSATITINAAEEASDNASLASLKISPGMLEPAFSPEVYNYQTVVSKETGSIYVSAEAEDAAARVTVSGNSPLYVGENIVHVFVTAENGTIQEYLITVMRQDASAPSPTPSPEPTPSAEPEPEEIGFEWKLEAENEDGEVFIQGNYRFKVCELPADITVPTGYTKTKLMISGITITAYAPASNESSDFVLLALQREGGAIRLYRYDRAEKTIQRFMSEDIVVRREDSGDGTATQAELAEEYKDNVTKLGLVIAALTAVWLLTAIGLIYFFMKSRGMRDDLD